MNTINILSREIERREYNTSKILNRSSFDLENKIKDYWKKKDGEKIFGLIRDFVSLQQLGYELSPQKDEATLPIVSSLASLVGLAELEDYDQLNFFQNKKINYAQSLPYPSNDCLEAYTRSLEEIKPTSLEQITRSFFMWVIQNSIDYLDQKSLAKEGKNYELNINGKRIIIDLEDWKGEKKKKQTNFDLSSYTVKTKSEKAITPQKTVIEEKVMQESYIYGHDKIKEEFQRIAMLIKDRNHFSKLSEPKYLFENYLLHGPPGTGKTTLVYGLAQQCGAEFRSIPCADLCSKYFGESAANIQEIYRQARLLIEKGNATGVILFFDEFDQIAGMRGSSADDRERNSLVTTLNVNLDGGNTYAGIITFAATNIPNILDKAILNRFHTLEVGYPKRDEEIIGIHKTVIGKMEDYAKKNVDIKLFADIEYYEILKFSYGDERYKSGRVINRILQNSVIKKAIITYPNVAEITTADILKEYEKYDLEQEKKYSSTMGTKTITG
ncbi:AAA family ATPase [Candidatus Woesearchaeota archaeon]|nr:AAA family ATPase [Candidatus Woesearchaeota archaeon]